MPGRHRRCSNTPSFFGLGEMMNVPGILNGNPEACSKVAAALNLDKPVDGHAPLCTGADLEAYARAGIRTDHECTTTAELRERISLGMYVSIREGSLARNLLPLIENLTADLSRRCSFCTDADTLERGHINGMLAMAVKAGIRPVDAVRMATLNTAECYGLRTAARLRPDAEPTCCLSTTSRTLGRSPSGRRAGLSPATGALSSVRQNRSPDFTRTR